MANLLSQIQLQHLSDEWITPSFDSAVTPCLSAPSCELGPVPFRGTPAVTGKLVWKQTKSDEVTFVPSSRRDEVTFVPSKRREC